MGFTKYLYTRINWVNKSDSLSTPLGKTNLNHMDSAIYNIAENLNLAYDELSTGKFDESDAGKVIVGMPTWDSSTGILTFQFYDGTQFSVDFNIEKIPVSFSMDSAGVITMTTSDGTEWKADIGDVIPDYVFEDSDRIVFTRTKNADGSYSVSADIKKNSITDDFLQPNYLADITQQASAAANSATQASDYADDAAYDAKLARSYAVGGSGVREGESADNAKKYKEQCQEIFDDFRQSGTVVGVKGEKESEYRKGLVNVTPENIGALPEDGTAAKANKIIDSGDSRELTFSYSKPEMNYSEYSWLAAWNGDELRAVSKEQFAQKSELDGKLSLVASTQSYKASLSFNAELAMQYLVSFKSTGAYNSYFIQYLALVNIIGVVSKILHVTPIVNNVSGFEVSITASGTLVTIASNSSNASAETIRVWEI